MRFPWQRPVQRGTSAESLRGLVVVVGAGLAGLVAATTIIEAGHEVLIVEADGAPGGTSAHSTGWIWRYRKLEDHGRFAPAGSRELQERIWHELPECIPWLERRGARLRASGTANALTDGVRLDIPRCIDGLSGQLPSGVLITGTRVVSATRVDDADEPIELTLESLGGVRTRRRAARVIFAGGGFAANLVRVARAAHVADRVRDTWFVRAADGADGSSQDVARQLGVRVDEAAGASYARMMPRGAIRTGIDWARGALPVGAGGEVIDGRGRLLSWSSDDWADTQRTWQLATSSGTGWIVVEPSRLEMELSYGTVRQTLAYADSYGARVMTGAVGTLAEHLEQQLGVELEPSARNAANLATHAIETCVGVTHTLGGIEVDVDCRAGMGSEAPHDVLAAGVDVGGIALGGYTSGLAQALVLGRRAGRTAAGVSASG